MKKLLTLLFSLFFLSSPSVFADDISDFQIEGISIGDSLLDYMTEDEILKEIEVNKDRFLHLKEPYKYLQINQYKDFPTFDSLSFLIKNNSTNQYIKDKNEKYTILYVAGSINFYEDFDNCIVKRDAISESISSMFPDIQKTEELFSNSVDPSGNSIIDGVYYRFDSGAEIDTYCENYEKKFRIKMNWDEGLKVSLSSVETTSWLYDY
jgi:hypothetical protein